VLNLQPDAAQLEDRDFCDLGHKSCDTIILDLLGPLPAESMQLTCGNRERDLHSGLLLMRRH
jgi:hypothetical protein